MKLNTSDFFVENKVLAASEQGVVYDLPRDRIQEVWDKLAIHYAEKSKSDYRSEMLTEDFFRLLGQARAENETALETFQLLSSGVLACYDATESKEQRFNIKRVVIDEVLKILRCRRVELRENIERERSTYDKLKDLDANIRIVDGVLRLYTTPFNSLPLDQVFNRKNCCGLLCTVKYRNRSYEGYFGYPPEKLSTVDFLTFEGTFRRGDTEVTIKNEFSESTHQICTTIVRELLSGREMKSILPVLPVLLSRFHTNEMTQGSQKKQVIQVGASRLIDGLSPVFYVLTDDSVVKVVRSGDGFEIYQNGIKRYG